MTNYEWAGYHPHFHGGWDKNNTVYFSRTSLELPGATNEEIPGADALVHSSPFIIDRHDTLSCKMNSASDHEAFRGL